MQAARHGSGLDAQLTLYDAGGQQVASTADRGDSPDPRLEVTLRHEASLLTLRAWSDRPRAEALSRLRPLLRARLAAEGGAAPEGRPPGVRRIERLTDLLGDCPGPAADFCNKL